MNGALRKVGGGAWPAGARLVAFALLAAPAPAAASVSQTLTDEAQVLKPGSVRVNSWVEIDEEAADHQLFAVLGVLPRLELAAGGLWGRGYGAEKSGWGAAGPAAQLKAALVEPTREGRPGLAIAAAGRAPWGNAGFGGDGWVVAGEALATFNVGRDAAVFHANAGLVANRQDAQWDPLPLGGAGVSLALVGHLRAQLELFHNDTFLSRKGGLAQGGLRYVVSERVSVDAFVGAGIWGAKREPVWGLVGVKLDSSSQ